MSLLVPPLVGLVADARRLRGWLLRLGTLGTCVAFLGFLRARLRWELYAITAVFAFCRAPLTSLIDATTLAARAPVAAGATARSGCGARSASSSPPWARARFVERGGVDVIVDVAAWALFAGGGGGVRAAGGAAVGAAGRRRRLAEALARAGRVDLRRRRGAHADGDGGLRLGLLAAPGAARLRRPLHRRRLGHRRGRRDRGARRLGGALRASRRRACSRSRSATAAVRWTLLARVVSPAAILCLQPLHGITFGLFWVSGVTVMRDRGHAAPTAAQGLFAAAYGAGSLVGMNATGQLLELGGGPAAVRGRRRLRGAGDAGRLAVRAAHPLVRRGLRAAFGGGRAARRPLAYPRRAMDAAQTVRAAVARALARMPGGRWVVACSGGPDSTALADALAVDGTRRLHVVAVDHGLRPAAAGEAAAVAAWARARGLEAAVVRVAVDGKLDGGGAPRPLRRARRRGAPRRRRRHRRRRTRRRIRRRRCSIASCAAPARAACRRWRRRAASTRRCGWCARSCRCRAPTSRPTSRRARSPSCATRPTMTAPIGAAGCATRCCRSCAASGPGSIARSPRPAIACAPTPTRSTTPPPRPPGVSATPTGTLDAAALARAARGAVRARGGARAAASSSAAVHVAALRRLCATANGTRSLDLPARLVAERRYGRLRFFAARANSRVRRHTRGGSRAAGDLPS